MFRGPDAVFVVWPNVVELMLIGKPASLFVGPTRNAVWLKRSRNNASRFTYARPAEMRFAMLRSRFHNPGPYRKMRCPSSPGVVGDCKYCGLARPSGPISFRIDVQLCAVGAGPKRHELLQFVDGDAVEDDARVELVVCRPSAREKERPPRLDASDARDGPPARHLAQNRTLDRERAAPGPNGSSYVQ